MKDIKRRENLALKIRLMMAYRNMTAKDLAKRTGCSYGAAAAWMSGRRLPTFDKITDIALALDCPVNWLDGDAPVFWWEVVR